LERIVPDEHLLQAIELAVAAQAFNRLYGPSGGLDGEQEAGQDRFAVQEHRAGAAGTDSAALLGAGQVQVLAQRVQEGVPWRHPKLLGPSIDGQRDEAGRTDGGG
jgi:hypothetical protein